VTVLARRVEITRAVETDVERLPAFWAGTPASGRSRTTSRNRRRLRRHQPLQASRDRSRRASPKHGRRVFRDRFHRSLPEVRCWPARTPFAAASLCGAGRFLDGFWRRDELGKRASRLAIARRCSTRAAFLAISATVLAFVGERRKRGLRSGVEKRLV